MPAITIEIDKRTGEVKIEGHGFQGMECELPIDDLANLLGETIEKKPKGNIYEVFVGEHLKIGG